MNLILGLKPSTYKMNNGTSDRTHWGLISQDIEELLKKIGLTDLDFAGFIKSPKTIMVEEEEEYETKDENGETIVKTRKVQKEQIIEGEYNYSLRYDEFIAPIILFIQALYHKYEGHEKRITTLETENAALKDRVDKAEAKIAELEAKLNQVLVKLD